MDTTKRSKPRLAKYWTHCNGKQKWRHKGTWNSKVTIWRQVNILRVKGWPPWCARVWCPWCRGCCWPRPGPQHRWRWPPAPGSPAREVAGCSVEQSGPGIPADRWYGKWCLTDRAFTFHIHSSNTATTASFLLLLIINYSVRGQSEAATLWPLSLSRGSFNVFW